MVVLVALLVAVLGSSESTGEATNEIIKKKATTKATKTTKTTANILPGPAPFHELPLCWKPRSRRRGLNFVRNPMFNLRNQRFGVRPSKYQKIYFRTMFFQLCCLLLFFELSHGLKSISRLAKSMWQGPIKQPGLCSH